MPSVKLLPDGVLFKHSPHKVVLSDEQCRKCCCLPAPENEGSTLLSDAYASEPECNAAGGSWVDCPRVCPCDCNCDWDGSLEIKGDGDYPFTTYPDYFFPFDGIGQVVVPGDCTKTKGPYGSQRHGPVGVAPTNTRFFAEIVMYMTLDCCTNTLSIAVGIIVSRSDFFGQPEVCGTLNAVISSHFPMKECGPGSLCPSGEPIKTITEEWNAQPGGADNPYTTLAGLQGYGIYLDDVLDPIPSVTCSPVVSC
jgi:hypothetical protein